MIKKSICGNEMDKMPDFAYKIMAFIFKIREMISSPEKLLNEFGIQEGNHIIDYGCGPGLYIKKASELAGDSGQVYAVDVQELAIADIKKRIEKEGLKNIKTFVANGYNSKIEPESADIIYGLDMFHMIGEPDLFLNELNRIIKKDGLLFIDNGHQSRDDAKKKIVASKKWRIELENKQYMKCVPLRG